MSLTTLLQKILAWLQAGYPKGIPQQDYFPLLALLARDLKPEEVSEVVNTLEADHGMSHRTTTADVEVAIEQITNSPALIRDVQRVEEHLRDSGWDLQPSSDP